MQRTRNTVTPQSGGFVLSALARVAEINCLGVGHCSREKRKPDDGKPSAYQDELKRVATHEHESIELSGLKGGVNDAHFKAVVRSVAVPVRCADLAAPLARRLSCAVLECSGRRAAVRLIRSSKLGRV